jgi:hypothetical protein
MLRSSAAGGGDDSGLGETDDGGYEDADFARTIMNGSD